jgi:protein TonB
MSEAFGNLGMMGGEMEFGALLERVLRQRSHEATPPAGLVQRLNARLALEAERSRPLSFVEAGRSQRSSASMAFAVFAHACVLLLVLGLASRHMQVTAPLRVAKLQQLVTPMPPLANHTGKMAGGGGQHDLAAATQGRLPKFANQQIVPPKAPPTIPPKLAVDPTLVMQKDLKMANNTMPNLGLPSSSLPGVSLGTGSGGGIGSGNGNGLGPGSGGSMGGGVMHAGSAQVGPRLIYSPEPEFSEEARKAKFSGDVQVYLIVDEHGMPTHVRVARGVGMGLDEKAVEAVRQYRFKPATQNGRPVKVDMYIDVNFQIF